MKKQLQKKKNGFRVLVLLIRGELCWFENLTLQKWQSKAITSTSRIHITCPSNFLSPSISAHCCSFQWDIRYSILLSSDNWDLNIYSIQKMICLSWNFFLTLCLQLHAHGWYIINRLFTSFWRAENFFLCF